MAVNELVSVVIPTRDRWELLATTLETVVCQEEVELDIIVVDDGSHRSRASAELCSSYRAIRVVRHSTSKGVAAARNSGMAVARGQWIAFLDDDDLWAPRKLRIQIDAALAAGGAFAYAGVILMREDTSTLRRMDAPPAARLRELLRSYNAIPAGASNVIVDATTVQRLGGFDERLAHLADWDYWIRLASLPGGCCPDLLVAYRLHAESMRSVGRGVLRELQYIDAKHFAGRAAPRSRILVYRWLAEGHLTGGRRVDAAKAYARGAVKCFCPSDLVRAARALTPRPVHTAEQNSPVAASSSELQWLEAHLTSVAAE